MSIHIMNLVWKRAPYRGEALLCLLALADNANDEGHCWPSIPTLAKKTRANERTVYRSIDLFQKDEMVRKKSGGGRMRSNEYWISLTKLQGLPDLYGKTLTSTTETLTSTTLNPGTVSPESSKNHQGNHQEDISADPVKEKAAPPTESDSLPSDSGGDSLAAMLYDMYPRHVGRAAAIKAIWAAIKKEDIAFIKEAVEEYAVAVSQWSPRDKQYIPHPATWFNQERWKDDRKEWRKGNTGVPAKSWESPGSEKPLRSLIEHSRRKQEEFERTERAGIDPNITNGL